MLNGKVGRKISAIAASVILLATISPMSVVAAEPSQANPDTAQLIFNGISLLSYYTNALGFVLSKNPAEVEARLAKMPFANIPPSLEQSTDNISLSSVEISQLVVTIDKNIGNVRDLIGQSRLTEATKLAAVTFSGLSQAYVDLGYIQLDAETTGAELKVSSAPDGSALKLAYDQLLEMIDRIRQLLDLYKQLLLNLFMNSPTSGNITAEQASNLADKLTNFKQILNQAGTSPEISQQVQDIIDTLKAGNLSPDQVTSLSNLVQSLSQTSVSQELLTALASDKQLSTNITLEIQPSIAFVGDNITFRGLLTSEGKPMAGRKVDILLNSSTYITVETDESGQYQGSLQVPYWYIPDIDVQALYFPRDNDVGIYLASVSPVAKLKALFYDAGLKITAPDKSYPGLETTITGVFDYGQDPSLDTRKVEIYLDNTLIFDGNEQKTFNQKIKLEAATEAGRHNIIVSAAADRRYAPVVSDVSLNVIQAVPVLDLNIPKWSAIPGTITFSGRLHSDAGPLNKAPVTLALGTSQANFTTSEDGTFNAKINVGPSFGLIGSQVLTVQAVPNEPWNAPLSTTRNLIIVNWVNCGGILIILGLVIVYLPRRVQRKFSVYLKKKEKEIPVTLAPAPVPTYSASVVAQTPVATREEALKEPRDRIFGWYRQVVKLIQSITKSLFGPQQTLREFSRDSSKRLGPAAKYFIELTAMVERLLYSRYRPSDDDAEKSKELSNQVEEGLKG